MEIVYKKTMGEASDVHPNVANAIESSISGVETHLGMYLDRFEQPDWLEFNDACILFFTNLLGPYGFARVTAIFNGGMEGQAFKAAFAAIAEANRESGGDAIKKKELVKLKFIAIAQAMLKKYFLAQAVTIPATLAAGTRQEILAFLIRIQSGKSFP